jgi:DNA-binding transcriptional ArsR family regulator
MRKSIMDTLISKTKQNILSATLLKPDKWWYLSDLAKHLKTRPSSLQRDLLRLTVADILEKRQEGNRTYYRANTECPIFNELQGLLIKTVGIRDKLASALQPLSQDIHIAFIYGSIAKKEEMSTSDVDIMIIGNVNLADVVSLSKPAEIIIGREINPTVYQPNEFKKGLTDKSNFLMEVMEGEKVFIIGNESKLAEIS